MLRKLNIQKLCKHVSLRAGSVRTFHVTPGKLYLFSELLQSNCCMLFEAPRKNIPKHLCLTICNHVLLANFLQCVWERTDLVCSLLLPV